MHDIMIDVVEEVTKGSVALDESVNIHHNFCQCERCIYKVSKMCFKRQALSQELSINFSNKVCMWMLICLLISDSQDPSTGETVEQDLYVTRKGATPAGEGQMGLIPGSMGALLCAYVLKFCNFLCSLF